MVARGNWVGVLIIQIYKYLGIMTTLVVVVVQEGDMTKEKTG